MIAAAVVAVVYDGRQILSSRPALLQGGTVTVPLDPFMTSLVRRVEFDPSGSTIRFVRGDDSVTVALGTTTASAGSRPVRLPIAPYLRDGGPIIPLAAIARLLGFEVAFDGRRRVVAITTSPPEPVATMTPFVPVPTGATFAPVRIDATPTPRPTVTGMPRPRRTPIEVNAQTGPS